MVKLALEQELLLDKVHRVTEFDQEAWLRKYIDLNTMHRTNAKNDFEKDLFKFLKNSVFGKTMKNKRLQRGIRLVPTERKRTKLTRESNLHSIKDFFPYFSLFEIRKKSITIGQASQFRLFNLRIKQGFDV